METNPNPDSTTNTKTKTEMKTATNQPTFTDPMGAALFERQLRAMMPRSEFHEADIQSEIRGRITSIPYSKGTVNRLID